MFLCAHLITGPCQEAPAVNHSLGFRECIEGQTSGWHSSNVESQFSCLKRFVRARYGILVPRNRGPVHSGTLYEWVLRTIYPDLTFLDWLAAASAGAKAA